MEIWWDQVVIHHLDVKYPIIVDEVCLGSPSDTNREVGLLPSTGEGAGVAPSGGFGNTGAGCKYKH